MLKNCILIVFLVLILGSSNCSSEKSSKSKTDHSGIETVINVDNDYSLGVDLELPDNEGEDFGRHNKFFRKIKTSDQFHVLTDIIRIQTQKSNTFIFPNYYSPLLNNLPPPITG